MTTKTEKLEDISDNDTSSDCETDIDSIEQNNEFPQLINHFFTNEDGQNIADILTELKTSLDTHNKLIFKLLSLNSQKKK